MPADASSLSLDRFDLDDRFVEILREPEEEKLDDVLKDEGEDGEKGQAARDDSGKMGREEMEDGDQLVDAAESFTSGMSD